ncbi:MAG: hypothetical protein Q8L48_31985 [Archangium sp.]|nr:hypothetical protein [Archangium sp.]
MPKVTSSRAKTVAAPKKPAARPKAKATEKKVAPKSTGWTAKGGTKKTTVGGRGSDVSTRDSRERVANLYVGGRGSDNSTADSRRRIADIYAGGRSSGSSYNGGGRGS